MTEIVRQFESSAHGEIQEEIACPLCGHREHAVALVGRDRLFWKPGEYPLVRCAQCQLLYVNPRPTPEALGRHYPEEYFAYALPSDTAPWVRAMMRWFDRGISMQRIRYLEKAAGRLTPQACVVDVGCGVNNLLYWVERTRGSATIGVDFNPQMVEWIESELGMRAAQGTLEEANFEQGSIDVVTMTEYLEHEPDPARVLHEARRVLKPEGHVAIEIPDVSGWPARWFGSRWWNLDVPRHLIFFEPDTLERMLDACGFELLRIQRFGLPFYIGTSLFQALGFRYTPRHHNFFVALATTLGVPFLPMTPLIPEFLFAVARPK